MLHQTTEFRVIKAENKQQKERIGVLPIVNKIHNVRIN
jgi:hypothetical protein